MVAHWKVEPGGGGGGMLHVCGEWEGHGDNVMLISLHVFNIQTHTQSQYQFGMRAFSGPRNMVPTLVACSLEE